MTRRTLDTRGFRYSMCIGAFLAATQSATAQNPEAL
jgi:hypothetical protein